MAELSIAGKRIVHILSFTGIILQLFFTHLMALQHAANISQDSILADDV